MVAQIHAGADSVTDEQAEANGQLVAAAPDMLRALRQARRVLLATEYSAEYRAVDMAIRRAQGRG